MRRNYYSAVRSILRSLYPWSITLCGSLWIAWVFIITVFLLPSDNVSYMIWSDINRISSSTPLYSLSYHSEVAHVPLSLPQVSTIAWVSSCPCCLLGTTIVLPGLPAFCLSVCVGRKRRVYNITPLSYTAQYCQLLLLQALRAITYHIN